MGTNKLHRGLGRSFGKMFGTDKVRTDYLSNEEKGSTKNDVVELSDDNNQTTEFIEKEKISIKQNSSQETTSSNENNIETNNDNINQIIVESIDDDNGENNPPSIDDEQKNNNENNNHLYIKINLVQPNVNQPRKHFDEEELKELSESIKKYGVVEPLVVRKNGPLFEIIAGERRWRAAKLADLEEVPVVIKDYDDRTAKEVSLIENIQRADLNPVEEALAYQNLIQEYGLTQEEVARRVSKNRSTITNALRILNLNSEIQEMLRTNQLSQGHARALLSIEDTDTRDKIAKKVIDEKLSVRDIEKLVRLENLSKYRDKKRSEQNTDVMIQLKTVIKDLEKKLKNKLNTKVGIVPKNENSGKIEIEYYSKDDLDRIFVLLNGINEGE